MNTTVDYMPIIRGLKLALLRDYDPQIAPVNHAGDGGYFTENFAMMITYAKLTDVHEQSMEFSLVLGMLLMWSDTRLTWDPARYGNISHMYFALRELWFPNFHPCESSAVTYLSLDRDQVVKVFPNGDIRTILQAEITYSCSFDTSSFPFDTQKCNLCFVLNGYDPDDFKFSASLDDNALSTDMSEWRLNISSITTSFDQCIHDLYYPITLSRNPQFWIGLVIVPIFMLGFLILIGLFYSGPEDLVNNAIGFGLETMMSMMVVVGILNDSLSKIESIPALGLFVLVQIVFTSAAVITVMLTDKLRRALIEAARNKTHKCSRRWRFIRWITTSELVLRNFLFVLFSILHISNLVWLMSYQGTGNASAIAAPASSDDALTTSLLSR